MDFSDLKPSNKTKELSPVLENVPELKKVILEKPIKLKKFKTEKLKENKNQINLISTSSMCSEYIRLYSEIIKLDKRYMLKYISHLKYVQFNQRNERIEEFNKVYSPNQEIKLNIFIDSDTGLKQFQIKDKLHISNNTIIVPFEYNNIVDHLANEIGIYKTEIVGYNKTIRDILPTNSLVIKLNGTCGECEFNEICDVIL